MYGRVFTHGRYDIGQKLDFLRANVELALDRPDLGPELGRLPRAPLCATRPGREARWPSVQAAVLGGGAPPRADRGRPAPTRLGLVLAERVIAPEAVPPFPNTAMDGYAVRAADTSGASEEHPVRLQVVGELAAGHAPTVAVGPGEAIRIMTGAPMPDGADAIVMVERTARDGDDGVSVTLEVEPGRHVRRAGGDLEAGDVVFEPGQVLTAARIGVLATRRRPPRARAYPACARRRALDRRRAGRVGAARAGQDPRLQPADAARAARRRRRRRGRPRLGARRRGVHDRDARATRSDRCDAVITSGGVSVGDFDYVSDALERIAADDRAAIRASTGTRWRSSPRSRSAFGDACRARRCSGCPATRCRRSSASSCSPGPRCGMMMGHRPTVPAARSVATAAARDAAAAIDGKLHLDRVVVDVVDGRYVAAGVRSQESNALAATAAANALALVPDGEGVDAGDDITVMLLD